MYDDTVESILKNWHVRKNESKVYWKKDANNSCEKIFYNIL